MTLDSLLNFFRNNRDFRFIDHKEVYSLIPEEYRSRVDQLAGKVGRDKIPFFLAVIQFYEPAEEAFDILVNKSRKDSYVKYSLEIWIYNERQKHKKREEKNTPHKAELIEYALQEIKQYF